MASMTLTREVETESDRLKRILEQMPIGVAIATAPSGQIFFHNPEAVAAAGKRQCCIPLRICVGGNKFYTL